jgi:NDP-sugar pyrophosphorylase family protein
MKSSAPDTAKSMIPVAGKPFIAWQLEWLASQGVGDVVLSIGYMGEQIRSYVNDGHPFGLRVTYVNEGEHLLGTAGALRLASDVGALDERFFVLYGDSYLDVSLAEVWAHFERLRREALMTVYRNNNVGEVSNAVFNGTLVTQYAKNSVQPPNDMVFVDYGLLVLTRALIEEHISPAAEADLAQLLETLSSGGNLAGYEVTARFFEIGSPEGLDTLERELYSRSSGAERTELDDR